MTKHCEQLSSEERATVMVMAQEGQSLRAMARTLHRAPATISREWRRHTPPADAPGRSGDDAKLAGQEARRCRFKPPRSPKLAVNGVPFGVVEHVVQEGWSPGRVSPQGGCSAADSRSCRQAPANPASPDGADG